MSASLREISVFLPSLSVLWIPSFFFVRFSRPRTSVEKADLSLLVVLPLEEEVHVLDFLRPRVRTLPWMDSEHFNGHNPETPDFFARDCS